MLLSQDEARFPMVPTLAAALGVQGFRLTVGTRDCKDLLYVLAVVNVVTAALHGNTLESPARAKQVTGQEQDEADAGGVRQPPAARRTRCTRQERHRRVVLIIDNAPWHRGKPIDEALADNPAPGVQAIAQLQPATQRHRALLEAVAAAGDTQPVLREAVGLEAFDPGQPVLLPDGGGAASGHGRRVLRPSQDLDSTIG